MGRVLLPIALACAGVSLVGCGKSEPPLPPLAAETFRFALTPTPGEVPRELRVTLEVPSQWARTSTTVLKTFKSGDDAGVIFGSLSLQLARAPSGDPAQVSGLIAARAQNARPLPSEAPGVTRFEIDRGGTILERVVATELSAAGGYVMFCSVEQSSGYSATLGERLFESCRTAKLELLATTLPPELEKAEHARLAQCPAQTNVVFQRAERARGPTAFGAVRAARAFATSGDAIEIDLANYPHDEWTRGAIPSEEGQLRLTFEILPGVDKHVVSGHYPVRGGRGFEGSSAARMVWDDVRSRIPLAVEHENHVEVVARTRDRVCGRFVFSDGVYTLRGTFDLELTIGREVGKAEP